jgi:hypothetical protein
MSVAHLEKTEILRLRASADNVFGTWFQTTFPSLPPYSKGEGRLKTQRSDFQTTSRPAPSYSRADAAEMTACCLRQNVDNFSPDNKAFSV